MNVYVVFAHPSRQSFSHCVMQAFTRGLADAGQHSVEHLEETGIAESMRRIMVNDRLLGVG